MDVCLGGCASVLRAEKRSASQFGATFQGAWSWQVTRGSEGGRGSLRAKKRGIPVDSGSVGGSSQPVAAAFSPPGTQRCTGSYAWKGKEAKDSLSGEQGSHLWVSTANASQGCLRPRLPFSTSQGQQIGYSIGCSKTELQQKADSCLPKPADLI